MFPRIFKLLQYRYKKCALKKKLFTRQRKSLFTIFFRRFGIFAECFSDVFVIVDYFFVLFYYKLVIKNQRYLIWDILNF